MPIVTVSHKTSATRSGLERLRRELPALVSDALACPEEPYDGELRPGDVNLRFVAALPPDEGLDYLVEVRTKWTKSRDEDLQVRSDRLATALTSLGVERLGVWVELTAGAWSQPSGTVTP
jgi:hypothetical protein